MNASKYPRSNKDKENLIVFDAATHKSVFGKIESIKNHIQPGDLLVVNDAATMPSSHWAQTEKGERFELRLASAVSEKTWKALAMGDGTWQITTESRGAAPQLKANDNLIIDGSLQAIIRESHFDNRFITLEFQNTASEIWSELLKNGKPIQYSYLEREFNLNQFQTVFSSKPWALEMPSAGRPLSWNLIQNLVSQGVNIATLTHAAGISSTGNSALDALLPLPERSEIPQSTVNAIALARKNNKKIIAVGTTVVRALEGRYHTHKELTSGTEITDLRIHDQFQLNVVDALLSGLHDPTESHFELMRAFAPAKDLQVAFHEAEKRNFLCHEFGDSILIFRA